VCAGELGLISDPSLLLGYYGSMKLRACKLVSGGHNTVSGGGPRKLPLSASAETVRTDSLPLEWLFRAFHPDEQVARIGHETQPDLRSNVWRRRIHTGVPLRTHATTLCSSHPPCSGRGWGQAGTGWWSCICSARATGIPSCQFCSLP
jgi:hypothetical protein